jgi:hypothetical protein
MIPWFVPSPTTPASTAVNSSATSDESPICGECGYGGALQCRPSRTQQAPICGECGYGGALQCRPSRTQQSMDAEMQTDPLRHARRVEAACKPITTAACGSNFVSASALPRRARSLACVRTPPMPVTKPFGRMPLSPTSALALTGGLVPAPVLAPLIARCAPLELGRGGHELLTLLAAHASKRMDGSTGAEPADQSCLGKIYQCGVATARFPDFVQQHWI